MYKHIMEKFIAFSTLALVSVPAVASAQLTDVLSEAGTLGQIVNALIPVAFALAILFFFWGLAMYVLAAGDEEKKGKGRSIMIWGVIAIFVLVAIWGIVALIADVFGIDPAETQPAPNVNLPDVQL
jgi:hypothetical protein